MATANSTNSPARKGPSPKRLTDITILNAKLPSGKVQHDIFDTVLPGFGLRIGKRRKS